MVISLSIDETNKLRAKLGLKPLNVNADGTSNRSASEERELEKRQQRAREMGGTLIEGDKNNTVHIPAKNIGEASLADKMRERLAERKKKREMEAKLMMTKGLGADSGDEGDAQKWVKRQKKAAKEKAKAAKAAKAFEALDDEFGIGSMVDEDAKKERQREYTSRDLGGLKVEHMTDAFTEGKSVILTLKDSGVLDEDAGDTLVNVNIADDERTKKRNDDLKKIQGRLQCLRQRGD